MIYELFYMNSAHNSLLANLLLTSNEIKLPVNTQKFDFSQLGGEKLRAWPPILLTGMLYPACFWIESSWPSGSRISLVSVSDSYSRVQKTWSPQFTVNPCGMQNRPYLKINKSWKKKTHELKNPFQSIAHLSSKFGHLRTSFFWVIENCKYNQP